VKLREINENPEWRYWVPDSIAAWDAPSHWERERLASMRKHLEPGMVLYDIGVEHGWLSAVYGGFCGYDNMVLVEPSPEFWPNIKGTWQANGFPGPIAAYQAFAGAVVKGDPVNDVWPACSEGVEAGGMAYRYIGQHDDIPTITIDEIRIRTRIPDAITVDIEGAELLALRGARHTLTFDRPLVWVSIHPDLMERDYGETDEDLHNFMRDHVYVGEHIHTDHEQHWLFTPEA
jgi:FkbM family methyltransferase